MHAPKLNILILAAGLSTRLGTPKPLVRIRGITLLRRALLLGASMSPHGIFAVAPRQLLNYRRESRGIPVRFIPHARRAEGLASSIQVGLRHARFAAAILILPVDLYALQSRDLLRLVVRWRALPGRLAATRIGVHGGIPLILPARHYSAAAQLQGDRGLRDALSRLRPAATLVDLPGAEFDIDTRQDLEAARRGWRPRGGTHSLPMPMRKTTKYT